MSAVSLFPNWKFMTAGLLFLSWDEKHLPRLYSLDRSRACSPYRLRLIDWASGTPVKLSCRSLNVTAQRVNTLLLLQQPVLLRELYTHIELSHICDVGTLFV